MGEGLDLRTSVGREILLIEETLSTPLYLHLIEIFPIINGNNII